MQPIQWFPGHMTKAMRMMEENLKLCDGAIVVLDARCAFACINKKLIGLFNNKPTLYVVNKTDLVESQDLSKVVNALKEKNLKVLPIVGTNQKDAKSVYTAVIDSLSEKIQAKKERGINKTIRIMVCGVPNTGKSTIINSLAGKKQAQTGDKAGVTKGKQWIKLPYFELLDTPGTMPPSFDSQEIAMHLAYVGSINDNILDIDTLCLNFIEEMIAIGYGENLALRYKIDISGTPLEVYEKICKARGFVLRGNEYDYSRCSKAVFDDFRKGRLGKICLETKWIN